MCLYCDHTIEFWVFSGTARIKKWVPVHCVTEQLPQSVLSNILGFQMLTECDTLLSYSGKGKNTHLLTGVVKDDNGNDTWTVVFS